MQLSSSLSTISSPRSWAGFSGRVIAPGDADYDQARAVFYGGFDLRPAVIVGPANADEVARVATLARETGLELAVRGGAHSGAGHSTTDGGIVLDLSELRALHIDPVQRTAWAEAGLTARDYTAGAGAHGLATGFGDTGSVGIGGLTLGGGVGYLPVPVPAAPGGHGPRRHAAPAGHPPGRRLLRRRGPGRPRGAVDHRQHRGGPTAAVRALRIPRPADHHGHAGVRRGDRGRPAGRGPVPGAGDPLADMVRPMPYPEIYPPEEALHPLTAGHTMFVDTVDQDVAATMLDHLQEPHATMRAVQLRVLGGAGARVPVGATAFAHRHSRVMVNVAAFYHHPDQAAVEEAWVDGLAAALRTDDTGAYVNFLGNEGPERVRQAYPGATWDRLVEVKRRYDPDNLFRRNQNIPPD